HKLGYVPSIAAQRMSGSRSYLILALNDRERTIEQWRARDGNDWVDQMLLGGMLKCAEFGYRMIIELVDTRDEYVERELSAALASLQPDGIILTPPHSHSRKIISLLVAKRIPFVRVGSRSLGEGIPVSMDDEDAARLATKHLYDHGHTRIGFIAGSPDYNLSTWRLNGWKSTMKELGLPTEGLFEQWDFSLESGIHAARKLLQREDRPTGIIASNDQMSFGTLKVAAECGLSVPEDLSLISFDNSPSVRFCQPPLTAIDQPIAEMTSIAVDLIISTQRGTELPNVPVVEPATLIERGSVAAPAGRDG
ncbi:MAG: substrate-binding domain-containing protein, partial [Pseudomonadota bacterium]